jgi:hypothetical protein
VKKLAESTSIMLDQVERSPFVLASARRMWVGPSNLTGEVEIDLTQAWFGEEGMVEGTSIPVASYQAVPHAAIQNVFDAAYKRYKKLVEHRDSSRVDIEEAFKGELNDYL